MPFKLKLMIMVCVAVVAGFIFASLLMSLTTSDSDTMYLGSYTTPNGDGEGF